VVRSESARVSFDRPSSVQLVQCSAVQWSGESTVVRQSLASKKVNTEVEGTVALKAVTRQRLVKTQQTEKTSYTIRRCAVRLLTASKSKPKENAIGCSLYTVLWLQIECVTLFYVSYVLCHFILQAVFNLGIYAVNFKVNFTTATLLR
jgi:hypothetical protein